MQFWTWLWTIVWFGGIAIFAVVAAIVTIEGARDLKVLLDRIRSRRD